MKGLYLLGGAFLIPGVVFLLLPIHMSMTGVVLMLIGFSLLVGGLLLRKPTEARVTLFSLLTILTAACTICLVSAMSLITTSGQSDWDSAEKSDYAIVLGASVQENGKASRIMRTRLYAALEFMERNPDAMVILSGGKGADEPISEAQCMYDTLVEYGADPSRLILEEQSETTRENLLNSMEIIHRRGDTNHPITLITSEFHQRRGAYIAASLNIKTCPVSGYTDQWFYRINYTLREVFAFVKAAIQA